ncbi:MAG: Uma2 family endonuclease [Halochromatium sp.]
MPMPVVAPVEHYRIADYRRWEGDWELIQGIPLAMAPSPGIEHQRVARRLLRELDASLDDCPRCEALHEIDVEFSDDTVTRPDVLIICFEPDGDRITRTPALIAEVVSPKTARRDEQTKFQLYREEGVGYYMLLYPSQAKAKIYRLVEGEYRKVGDFQRESCPIRLADCTIDLDIARLWGR